MARDRRDASEAILAAAARSRITTALRKITAAVMAREKGVLGAAARREAQ
jgi:hypothetical protein